MIDINKVLVVANAALPSFIPHSVVTLFSILILGAIEGAFISKILKVQYSSAYWAAMLANLASTFIGIPVSWALFAAGVIPSALLVDHFDISVHPLVGESTRQALLFGGIRPSPWNDLGIAISLLVTLVPFWLGSIWSERKFYLKSFPEAKRNQLTQAVVYGNLVTYAVFAVYCGWQVGKAYQDLPTQIEQFEEEKLRSGDKLKAR